ncbi:sodium channel protein Nach-like [Diabrotica virgifera virgifera]|uniref:Sodium channel protein Nach-like n=1 Tax=Diabrotica virgifera virgifera TaxID=50390 RepID=A0A6P7F7U0_DIAVI|nr:sodium channel protein Nach-like [Diabrotica virgifera virgifera]
MKHKIKHENIENMPFKNTYEEYVYHSSLAGFVHLNSPGAIERYIWYIIHLLSLACTCFLINYTWQNFMKNPTMTTVEAMGSRLAEIPMPGISICNINKISRRKAQIYADELAARSRVSAEEILSNITLLGYLYEYNLPVKPERIIYFQNFLEKWDSAANGYYNTTDRLYRLQPTCFEVVKDCIWNGKRRPCEDIFVTELTMDGYCCVFNYVAHLSTTKISPIVIANDNKPISFGPTAALDFTILSNSSDTFFTTIATEAPVKILFSIPTDFPDTTSGGLVEKIIDRGTEIFLQVSSINTVATDEVKKYPPSKRGCIFSDEIKTLFGSYSYSDCIMDCKIRSIVALCQCVPFNFINVFNNPNDHYFQCTLGDLQCLNAYTNKWKTLYPSDFTGTGLEREKQDSIQCEHCIPTCSDTMYDVSSEFAIIYENGSVANYSLVHISYEKSLGMFNKQDAYFYWFDMLSMFGGICSITMGLSFVSVVEIFYFLIFVGIKKHLRKKRNKGFHDEHVLE